MADPIVQEIRQFREQHAKRFNNDLDAICSDLIERQRHSGHEVVSLKKHKERAPAASTKHETHDSNT